MSNDWVQISEACERNKDPILGVLRDLFRNRTSIFELGSGTGQHALFFSESLPHLHWQCADIEENQAYLQRLIQHEQRPNIGGPSVANFLDEKWTERLSKRYDGFYTANTLHIAPWEGSSKVFAQIGKIAQPDAIFAIYGPFNYNGSYTSDSNARFDQWLKDADPRRGIRDFEAVNRCAQESNWELVTDNEMPANNRLLVYKYGGL